MIWAGAEMILSGAVMIWAGACSNTDFPSLKMPKNAKKQSVTDGPTDGRTDRHRDVKVACSRQKERKKKKKEKKKKENPRVKDRELGHAWACSHWA